MVRMFGDTLKLLRSEISKTQEDIATAIGTSKQVISNYENSQREPDFTTLMKIADYFDVSTDYLLGRSDFKKENPEVERYTNVSKDHTQSIEMYRLAQRDFLEIIDDLFKASDRDTLNGLQRLVVLLRIIRELKNLTFIDGQPERPEFIRILDLANELPENLRSVYRSKILHGTLRYQSLEFARCEEFFYDFIAHYYEIAWKTKNVMPSDDV